MNILYYVFNNIFIVYCCKNEVRNYCIKNIIFILVNVCVYVIYCLYLSKEISGCFL